MTVEHVRVAIVADSAVLRAGLAALVAGEPSIEVVGALDGARAMLDGGSVASALHAHVDQLAPDVVLWVPSDLADVDMRTDDGDGANAHLDGEPTSAYVAVVDRVDAAWARQALAAGAGAVVGLDIDADSMVAVIRAVAAGLTVLPLAVSSALLSERLGIEHPPAALAVSIDPASSSLTRREREVLSLVAEGLPNKLIAPRLGISENTVKAHVASIYDKVGAGNRAEAVVAAARLGLLMI